MRDWKKSLPWRDFFGLGLRPFGAVWERLPDVPIKTGMLRVNSDSSQTGPHGPSDRFPTKVKPRRAL